MYDTKAEEPSTRCAWEKVCEAEPRVRLTVATVEKQKVTTQTLDACADHVDALKEMWQTRGAAVGYISWAKANQAKVPSPEQKVRLIDGGAVSVVLGDGDKPIRTLAREPLPSVCFDAQPPRAGVTFDDHLKQFQLFVHRLRDLVWELDGLHPDALVVTATLWELVSRQRGYRDDPKYLDHRKPYKVGTLRDLTVMIHPGLPPCEGYVARMADRDLEPMGLIQVSNF